MIQNKKAVLLRRLTKVEKHYVALRDYKSLVEEMSGKKNIYEVSVFNALKVGERAVLDAYLKRFSSIQDFLGAKLFPLVLDIAGISTTKMSDVLYYIEKEEIIDSLENWIEIRAIRNELEHDILRNCQIR